MNLNPYDIANYLSREIYFLRLRALELVFVKSR